MIHRNIQIFNSLPVLLYQTLFCPCVQGNFGEAVCQADDAAHNHLLEQVIDLSGPLGHTGTHGEASVSLGRIVVQIHDEDGLVDTIAAKEANIAALAKEDNQVNHLHAGNKSLLLQEHIGKFGYLGMDNDVHDAVVNHVAPDKPLSTVHGQRS